MNLAIHLAKKHWWIGPALAGAINNRLRTAFIARRSARSTWQDERVEVITCALTGAQRILCIGAHSDDIEIGCGGTVLRLLERSPDLEFYWMVLSSNPDRANEAQRSAGAFLRRARRKKVVVHSFRDGFLPYSGAPVKECFEKLKGAFAPDIVFTHCRDDLHQDHRLVCELTWNTFRKHLILEYEIPKYDGDLHSPNFFVPLPESIARKKVRCLMRYFASQRNKQWFTEDLFFALLRLRGIEANSTTRLAEGFHCRKLVMQQPEDFARSRSLR